MSQRSTRAKSFIKSKIKEWFGIKNQIIRVVHIQRSASIYTFILLLLTFIFLFLAFKNIQYPLLWNDEGDTVVFGQQVLRYGYPKIHGDKNVIYHFIGALPDLAVKKSIDAHILGNWGHYYFATPFLLIANLTKDPYFKTAILRIPFTALAIAGILLFGRSIASLADSFKEKIVINIIFLLIEISSIFIILEVRQARHHPLVLFFSMLLFMTYIKDRYFKKTDTKKYIAIVSSLLFVIFVLYYPVYFVFILTFIVIEAPSILKMLGSVKAILHNILSNRTILSILFSLLIVIPLFLYFEIPRVSLGLYEYFQPGIEGYFMNILFITSFLILNEFFLLLVFLKCYLFTQKKYMKNIKTYKISGLFFLFIVIYMLFISRSPFMYGRYLITLQPVISACLTLDMYLIYSLWNKRGTDNAIVLIFSIMFLVGGLLFKFPRYNGYIYELTHQYKGVIDYIVPYIRSKYENPQDLVIATNYEEQVLMYYLDSKVIVGFAGKNIKEDLKLDPDIIIPRKNIKNFQEEIQYLINKGGYNKTTFEVYDYPVNNIQELFFSPRHLFNTKFATNPKDALEIYEKIK